MMMMMAMGAFSGDFILLGCDGTFGVNFCVEMGMMLILDGVFFTWFVLAWGHFLGFGHAYGLILTRNITTLFSCYQFWIVRILNAVAMRVFQKKRN